jgi:hypothetical protein
VRRRRDVEELARYVGDVSQIPGEGIAAFHQRGRRGLIDWLASNGVTIPCYESGDITLAEWRWTFFEYTQVRDRPDPSHPDHTPPPP